MSVKLIFAMAMLFTVLTSCGADTAKEITLNEIQISTSDEFLMTAYWPPLNRWGGSWESGERLRFNARDRYGIVNFLARLTPHIPPEQLLFCGTGGMQVRLRIITEENDIEIFVFGMLARMTVDDGEDSKLFELLYEHDDFEYLVRRFFVAEYRAVHDWRARIIEEHSVS